MGAPMETMSLLYFIRTLGFGLLLVFQTCVASSSRLVGQIPAGFRGSQMNWIENNGLFLASNNSKFAFGFFAGLDVSLFLLVVLHVGSNKAVWTANGGLLVRTWDKFVFDKNGSVYLESENGIAWSPNITGERVTAMELLDNGNLVFLGVNRRILWQSFLNPTDTLLPGQEFLEGMKLQSSPNRNLLFHYLEVKSGDLILYAGFQTPQLYWSMANDSRKTIKKVGGKVYSASLMANSWNFYDQNRSLVWKFNFTENFDQNATWAAVLGSDGSISFYNLQMGRSGSAEPTKIPPQNPCSLPESCDPYKVCSFDNRCQCPSPLSSYSNCKPQNISTCNRSKVSVELLKLGDKLNYFALGFVIPFLKSDLNGCKEACLHNCSCLVLFFENSSGSCFLFDQIGSLQRSDLKATSFISYIKVSSVGHGLNRGEKTHINGRNHILFVVLIAVVTVLVLFGLIYLGFKYHRTRMRSSEFSQDISEDDDFLDSLSGMPVRFNYNDLRNATDNFSVKLGRGGFGSVYQGVLPDGTRLAVKKLEGIGQGKKEFRAEVSIIGSIHHVHLVKLKGFCAEGAHRLLVYEYMGKGSLDRWIFNNNKEDHMLDWETRFNIALGMAKGLAYLHEECDVKIIHCDIKPENVLLDDNYLAKVSDFGLAKLMNREQSHVFTTLRGTRGYLAPEWITNYAISEKSDVYSFGLVLLEIIAGRKNYDVEESSEKAHLPSYAFRMVEEGQLKELLDSKLKTEENDERVITAIKVALWCIQDDVHLRPPMTKVVQMLEGLCAVHDPPTSTQMSSHSCSSFLKWSSEDGTLSEPMNSGALMSDIRLSGPR